MRQMGKAEKKATRADGWSPGLEASQLQSPSLGHRHQLARVLAEQQERSPNLSMVVIKSEGTKESRSASRMPRGSSWATWWPRIWEKGKNVGARLGHRWTDPHPKPRSGHWPLTSHFRISTFYIGPAPSQRTVPMPRARRWQELKSV